MNMPLLNVATKNVPPVNAPPQCLQLTEIFFNHTPFSLNATLRFFLTSMAW
jgi:hypothetical protein